MNYWSDARQRNGENRPRPLRVAEKIRPYFILALDGGPATAFGLGFVWPDFRSQRHPPQ
jgi:hypothetical protein